MSFDWSQYFQLALELIKESDEPASEEAKSRAAISRAYYAVFCRARNFIEGLHPDLIKHIEKDHLIIVDYFNSLNLKQAEYLTSNMPRLKESNNKSGLR